MSTATTLTDADSMFPTAIECSMVDNISTSLASLITSLYLRCASTTSVTTSGKGPSSRIEPASTKGTPFFIHSYITPLLNNLFSTSALSPPALKTSLMACIWLRCPLTASVPSLTRMPSEVPSNAFSTSCTASALPARRPRSEEHTSELQSRQYLVC